MAFSDNEKLRTVKQEFISKLEEFNDWSAFVAFLQGLTKVQIKNFIINKLSDAANKNTTIASERTTRATDLGSLSDEVNLW